MSIDDLRRIFYEEKPYHPEWSVSDFGLMLSPLCLALLEFYYRHPQARRSMRAPSLRRVGWRPRPRPSKFQGLDQKQLASGEKPDDD